MIAPAGAALAVAIQFASYAPAHVDALPGEVVRWSNGSPRTHTVTADDGSYDSGQLLGGGSFERRFDAAGTFAYHCTLHPGMRGEVDVRPVILGPLPARAVVPGQTVQLSGRTADPASPVTIEADAGAGFRPAAVAAPAADGAWSASITAATTVSVRAVARGGQSETRRLRVSDRRVRVRATRAGVRVVVTPADPGARVRLEIRERERFGWWPTAIARLDYLSRAEFTIRRPRGRRVRAVLVDRDGWTRVATSPVVRLR